MSEQISFKNYRAEIEDQAKTRAENRANVGSIQASELVVMPVVSNEARGLLQEWSRSLAFRKRVAAFAEDAKFNKTTGKLAPSSEKLMQGFTEQQKRVLVEIGSNLTVYQEGYNTRFGGRASEKLEFNPLLQQLVQYSYDRDVLADSGHFLESAMVLRRKDNGTTVGGLNYTVNGNNGPGQAGNPTATDMFFWVKKEYEGTGVATILRQEADKAMAADLSRDPAVAKAVAQHGFDRFAELDAPRRLSLRDVLEKGTNFDAAIGEMSRHSYREVNLRAATGLEYPEPRYLDGKNEKGEIELGGGGKYYGLATSHVTVNRDGGVARQEVSSLDTRVLSTHLRNAWSTSYDQSEKTLSPQAAVKDDPMLKKIGEKGPNEAAQLITALDQRKAPVPTVTNQAYAEEVNRLKTMVGILEQYAGDKQMSRVSIQLNGQTTTLSRALDIPLGELQEQAAIRAGNRWVPLKTMIDEAMGPRPGGYSQLQRAETTPPRPADGAAPTPRARRHQAG